MKLSELIKTLQGLQACCGDNEIKVKADTWGCAVDILDVLRDVDKNYIIILDICGT